MNNLNMRLYGDNILREKCLEVKTVGKDIILLLDNMKIKMIEEQGVGLAGPQVGILKRIIVVMNPKTNEVIKMINPKIINFSENKCSMEEGCLSVLGQDNLPIFANVVRPESIKVEWIDINNKKQVRDFDTMMSRIIQHEIDHLDGILFTDYLSPVKRELLIRKIKKNK